MLLAQITDFHIGLPGSVVADKGRTSERLAEAVSHLNRLDPRPDAVVCTGDLVDTGVAGEYARLAELLAPLEMPAYLVPGNHDLRDNLRAAFRDAGHDYLPADGPLRYAIDLGPLRLVALDTLVEGRSGGRLDAEQLDWLDARLAEHPGAPTLVVQHHPPFATGIEAMDAMGLDGTGAEAEVVARHPQIERILCGHIHRDITCRFAGTLASTCPSTAHQVRLDLRSPGGLAIVTEPPMCMLHHWRTPGPLVSHASYIHPYDVPLVIS